MGIRRGLSRINNSPFLPFSSARNAYNTLPSEKVYIEISYIITCGTFMYYHYYYYGYDNLSFSRCMTLLYNTLPDGGTGLISLGGDDTLGGGSAVRSVDEEWFLFCECNII